MIENYKAMGIFFSPDDKRLQLWFNKKNCIKLVRALNFHKKRLCKYYELCYSVDKQFNRRLPTFFRKLNESIGLFIIAAKYIYLINDPESLKALIADIKSIDFERLGQIEKYEEPLIDKLSEDNDKVSFDLLILFLLTNPSRYIIYTLGEKKDPRAIDALVQIIDSEHYSSLLSIPTYLASWIDIKDSGRCPLYAIEALGKIDDIRSVKALIRLLTNKDIKIQFYAIQALYELQSPLAVEPLIRLLNNETILEVNDIDIKNRRTKDYWGFMGCINETQVKIEIYRTLIKIGDKSTKEYLLQIYNNSKQIDEILHGGLKEKLFNSSN